MFWEDVLIGLAIGLALPGFFDWMKTRLQIRRIRKRHMRPYLSDGVVTPAALPRYLRDRDS